MRAAYDYTLDSIYGRKFIVITDLVNNKRDVLSDMLNILAEIEANDERIECMCDYGVIYYDANGTWRGYWQTDEDNSFPLNKDTHKEAMERYVELEHLVNLKPCGCAVRRVTEHSIEKYIHNSKFL